MLAKGAARAASHRNGLAPAGKNGSYLECRMGRTFGKGLVFAILFLAALILINAGLAYRNTNQLKEDASWVAHTHEVLDALAQLRAEIVRAEAEQRTYVITGNDKHRQSFETASRLRHRITRLTCRS